LQPRLIHFMSDTGLEYSYSNTKLLWKWRSKTLLEVKNIVNQTFWLDCNSVLCNLYRDWNDSMWRHSDDEHELGADPIIVSITLWCTRIFKLRHKITKETVTLHLEAWSALLMWSWSQLYREHSLPKTKTAKNKRINLTFRTITP
jgi:alkylated DNA repair dioxygenase AlkB